MNKHMHKLSALETPALLTLALSILCALVVALGGPELQRTVTEMLIRVVVVVGLYIFIGNSGLMSFGHVAFMCVGAYGAAWFGVEPEMKAYNLPGLPDWILNSSFTHVPATLVSILLAAAVALATGLVLMRLSGIAISIATFALLAVVNVIYSNWETVTGGTSSVVGIPTHVNVWIALAWAAVALFVAQIYSHSGWGLQLRALREESIAAQACGVNLYRMALIAFVLSGAVLGLGGALQAQFLGVVNPDEFYLGQSFLYIAMLVVGGAASLTGAVAGVLMLSTLVECFVHLEQGITVADTLIRLPGGTQEIALGLVMIATLILRPKGWLGHTEWRLGRLFR